MLRIADKPHYTLSPKGAFKQEVKKTERREMFKALNVALKDVDPRGRNEYKTREQAQSVADKIKAKHGIECTVDEAFHMYF